ncbi:hypothetical protein HMPREF0185_02993 [Brevundimonas diminuta 470-4]|nr:hypothetical protein HMPREF0185_02993 [Brevundimonas diminuta 470-4]
MSFGTRRSAFLAPLTKASWRRRLSALSHAFTDCRPSLAAI